MTADSAATCIWSRAGEPVEQRRLRGCLTGEALHRQFLHAIAQSADLRGEAVDLHLQALCLDGQRVELGLGIEVGVGGLVGPIAGVGDLLGGLLHRVVGVNPHRGRQWHHGEGRDGDQHGRRIRFNATSQWLGARGTVERCTSIREAST